MSNDNSVMWVLAATVEPEDCNQHDIKSSGWEGKDSYRYSYWHASKLTDLTHSWDETKLI